jgi:yecA family protein
MSTHLPAYSNILLTLDKIDADIDPDELHGAMCGLLSANNNASFQHVSENLLQSADHDNLLHREALDALEILFETTKSQLNDPTCDFHLLLPENEESVEDQVFALSEWCQGFLLGLNLGGIKELDKLPEEGAEIAKDFLEIARAGSAYDIQESEEDEQSFEELMEYVRVGALLISEILNPEKALPPDRSKLH